MEHCKPYCDFESSEYTLRVYVEDVEEEKLVWHKDPRNEYFKVIGGRDWKLLIENNLPMNLEIGKFYYIPREVAHKMIKGKNNLILELQEK
jgi:quercetin dioxygenase-like cupin family protein